MSVDGGSRKIRKGGYLTDRWAPEMMVVNGTVILFVSIPPSKQEKETVLSLQQNITMEPFYY